MSRTSQLGSLIETQDMVNQPAQLPQPALDSEAEPQPGLDWDPNQTQETFFIENNVRSRHSSWAHEVANYPLLLQPSTNDTTDMHEFDLIMGIGFDSTAILDYQRLRMPFISNSVSFNLIQQLPALPLTRCGSGSAVHHDFLPCDVSTLLRTQECCGHNNIVRVTHPPHGDGLVAL